MKAKDRTVDVKPTKTSSTKKKVPGGKSRGAKRGGAPAKPEGRSTTTLAVVTPDLTKTDTSLAAWETQHKALVVCDAESQAEAITLVDEVKKHYDEVEALEKSITGPINASLNLIRGLFKPRKNRLLAMEKDGKSKLIIYQAELEAEAAKAKAKIEAQVERGKISEAVGAARMAAVEEPSNTIVSPTGGKVTFNNRKVLVIDDESKIPDKYWVVDEAAVEKALLAGDRVPGAHMDREKGASA